MKQPKFSEMACLHLDHLKLHCYPLKLESRKSFFPTEQRLLQTTSFWVSFSAVGHQDGKQRRDIFTVQLRIIDIIVMAHQLTHQDRYWKVMDGLISTTSRNFTSGITY